ncbi:UNVERIFIED_CONTAM: hypothetical protein K2H54_015310 [Gekko kuhli]
MLLNKIKAIEDKVSDLGKAINSLAAVGRINEPRNNLDVEANDEINGEKKVFKDNVITPICTKSPLASQHGQPKDLLLGDPRQDSKPVDAPKGDAQGQYRSAKCRNDDKLQEAETVNTMPETPLETATGTQQTDKAMEIELDLRSHRVIEIPANVVPNNVSLAIEMQEADQEWAQQFSTLPKMRKNGPVTIPVPMAALSRPSNMAGAVHFPHQLEILEHTTNPERDEVMEGTMLTSHLKDKLGTSFEDDFFLSFAELTNQEQLEVIERLGHAKNRLLALKKNTPDKKVGDESSAQDVQSKNVHRSSSSKYMEADLSNDAAGPKMTQEIDARNSMKNDEPLVNNIFYGTEKIKPRNDADTPGIVKDKDKLIAWKKPPGPTFQKELQQVNVNLHMEQLHASNPAHGAGGNLDGTADAVIKQNGCICPEHNIFLNLISELN